MKRNYLDMDKIPEMRIKWEYSNIGDPGNQGHTEKYSRGKSLFSTCRHFPSLYRQLIDVSLGILSALMAESVGFRSPMWL